MNASRAFLFALMLTAFCGSIARGQTNRWPGPLSPPPAFGPHPPGLLPPPRASPDNRWIGLGLPTRYLRTNFVVAEVEAHGGIPSEIALVVKPKRAAEPKKVPDTNQPPLTALVAALEALRPADPLDWESLKWMPFTNRLPIDLGPGDGERKIWIAGKWGSDGPAVATATEVRVDQVPPVIVITNPTERVTSRPMIQLQGYSDEPVWNIRYDVINATSRLENLRGYVTGGVTDLSVVGFATTTYFTCFDIKLAPGTNTIILRCEDYAGNGVTNILTYVFTTEHDKTPPAISLDRPRPGDRMATDTVTARGRMDDPTAQVVGVVVAQGRTNVVQGLVERSGYFWVEDIPLLPGLNHLTLTATDAAGNSSSTNLWLSRIDMDLSIDVDKVPPEQLCAQTVTLTGKVRPPNADVWVNGVQALVEPDGSWIATNVPVFSPTGGTVVFEARAIPRSAPTAVSARPSPSSAALQPRELTVMQSALSNEPVTLNAGRPVCGALDLRLTGVAGRSFVIEASTNLVHWTPILTNWSSEATFHYVHPNVGAHKCQFFRVVPLR